MNRDAIVVHIREKAFVPARDEADEVLLGFFTGERLGREGGREE
jgi:hypothetical protein